MRSFVLFILIWIILTAPSEGGHCVASSPPMPPGVVVEEVAPSSAGEAAGLRPGDTILSWERQANPPANPWPAGGTLAQPWEWSLVEWEQAPRGTVLLRVRRADTVLTCTVPQLRWGITVRPVLTADWLGEYLAGKALVQSGQLDAGLALWQNLADHARQSGDAGLAAWIGSRQAGALIKAHRWEAAAEFIHETLQDTSLELLPWQGGWFLFLAGESYYWQNQSEQSEQAYGQAAVWFERIDPDSLAAARSDYYIGIAASLRGDFQRMESHYAHAWQMYSTQAPGSYDTMMASWELAITALRQGIPQLTVERFEQTLRLMSALMPDSLPMARLLSQLGGAYASFDQEKNEQCLKQALSIASRLAPGGLDEGTILGSLGIVAYNRLDYESAEAAYRKRLAIQEKLAPGSQQHAMALQLLGILLMARGEVDLAEQQLSRSLAILENLGPQSASTAHALNSMGQLAVMKWDLDLAQQYYSRAHDILAKVAPVSSLMELNLIYQGQLASLRAFLHRPSEIRSELKNGLETPSHPEWLRQSALLFEKASQVRNQLTASPFNRQMYLFLLGDCAYFTGRLDEAEAYCQQAEAVLQSMKQGNADATLFLRARIATARGDLEKAHQLYLKAASATESAVPRLAWIYMYRLALVCQMMGRVEEARQWIEKTIHSLDLAEAGVSMDVAAIYHVIHPFYYKAMEIYLAAGQPGSAFQIMERYRGQQLLRMLSEREILFQGDIPAELAVSRARLIREYDRIQQELQQLYLEEDPLVLQSKRLRLDEIQKTLEHYREEIRQASPRLAALREPVALDVPSAREVMDPGTVALVYALGEERSVLFVFGRDLELHVFDLAENRDSLELLTEQFRQEILQARSGKWELDRIVAQGTHLYDVLLRPAERFLQSARRILIIPDRFLHTLPFSALVRGKDQKSGKAPRTRDWTWLAEYKPIHVALSATVFGELKKGRRAAVPSGPPKQVIAFGDPRYPEKSAGPAPELGDPSVRFIQRLFDLEPLPATRIEAGHIASRYQSTGVSYLGEQATEDQFRLVMHQASMFHFACHGLVNSARPLESGLALTIPEQPSPDRENGLLQVWEIFEKVRLDADLVVLSACETALGGEMSGEGLIGLTRAFQYAGARSVIASLWSIADESTAALMLRFYGYLKEGLPTDEALRRAQVDLIRERITVDRSSGGPEKIDASHPFFWAAFVLHGDWRGPGQRD